MTRRSPVVVTSRASLQIEEAAAWWTRNRPAAPGAIRVELERAFELLAIQPRIGAPVRSDRVPGVRRVHLSRVHYYVYYRVGATAVEILAFWHSSRGTKPEL